jgi:hypothetical protein
MSQKKAAPLAFWIPIGVAVGAGIGVALHNIPVGVGFGVAIGAVIGATQLLRAKKDHDVPS